MSQKFMCQKTAGRNNFSLAGHTVRSKRVGLRPEAVTSSGYTPGMHHDVSWRGRLSRAELARYAGNSCKSVRGSDQSSTFRALHHGGPGVFDLSLPKNV